ncbi:hypothetical protein BYT27DRAFT_7227366 [Phlegmacium glaucopus]|nr:hypothetical protein BYT27DRAFT_7227366 [Phlegmacium glaucopus]
MTGVSSQASAPTSNHSSVVPSEVGWQFVPQYYTFVNKEPHRLHCFYNKNSTFIHGTEGEDGKPCYGQQEIHNKITSIGFEDCKVFIHSVDAQSSANGGIIIQVIGEMSNHGDPWRKFVQTFFLAEQPNGYFVLNDIFRFLKEETLDGDGMDDVDLPEPASVPESVPAAQTVVSAPEPTYEPPREPTPPPAVVEDPVPVVIASVVADEAPTTDISEPHITQTPTPAPEDISPSPLVATAAQPNGIHTPEPEKQAPVVVAPVEPSPVPSPAPASIHSTPATATIPVPTPATAPAPAVTHTQPAAAPALAPIPAAPSAPRSWASLAASNSKKWGAAVNPDSRGTTEILSIPAPATNGIPAQAPQSAVAPNSAPQHHQHQQQRGGGQHGGPGGGGNQGGPRHEYPALLAAQSVSHAHCFVKGITDPISQLLLQTTLTSRFGPIKDLEIVRSRACAFIEFSSVDSARKAIVASLHQGQGGEGGIWVDVGGDVGQVRISVETKKEKADRQVGRGRGGGGGVVGSGGAQGAGNGNAENRGGGGGGSFRGRGGGGRGGRGGASGPK